MSQAVCHKPQGDPITPHNHTYAPGAGTGAQARAALDAASEAASGLGASASEAAAGLQQAASGALDSLNQATSGAVDSALSSLKDVTEGAGAAAASLQVRGLLVRKDMP